MWFAFSQLNMPQKCDIILRPLEAPNTALKTELRQRLQQLLQMADFGNRKPLQFLWHKGLVA